jgi:hypothetical protein
LEASFKKLEKEVRWLKIKLAVSVALNIICTIALLK